MCYNDQTKERHLPLASPWDSEPVEALIAYKHVSSVLYVC